MLAKGILIGIPFQDTMHRRFSMGEESNLLWQKQDKGPKLQSRQKKQETVNEILTGDMLMPAVCWQCKNSKSSNSSYAERNGY